MKVSQGASHRSELYSLLMNKLNKIGTNPLKKAVMHGIEGTLAEIFELGFQDAITQI